MLKKVLSLLLVAVITFSLAGCDIVSGIAFLIIMGCSDNDDRADKGEIFSFVRENEDKLLDAIKHKDYSAFENKGFIGSVSEEKRGGIDFSCGGAGFGPETAYVGFFYSEENSMYAVWCAPSSKETLRPYGNGFIHQDEGTDNIYYVEKICDKFYYYEAEF